MRLAGTAALTALILTLTAHPASSQETLERTPNLSGGWVGQNGVLYTNLVYRFTTARGTNDVLGLPTFDLGAGLPWRMLAGARFAHGSPTVPGRPNELELFARHHLLRESHGAPVDLGITGAFNTAAGSLDGEVSAARWFGPMRVLGAARAMMDGYDEGEARFALAGGAVAHPWRGRLPIALAADVGTLLDRRAGEQVAWSAAVQVGLSFTNHTLSLFAANTSTSTVQGLSRGSGRTRYGFEITVPIPAGRFLGAYVPREEAMEAVVEETGSEPPGYRAAATRYMFTPKRIEIPAGTVVEWTNADDVVHTVTAEDGSWESGGIQPGDSSRIRFDQPGTYPFYCGPHPFMKGVVIVR